MSLRPTPFQTILVISVLLHGALGWWLSRHPLLSATATASRTPVIRITLAHALPRPEPEPPPQPEAEPEPAVTPQPDRTAPPQPRPTRATRTRQTASRPSSRPKPAGAPSPPPPAQAAAPPTSAHPLPRPMPAPGPDPLLEAEYLAGLRAAIMRHHYYPTRARRRHEEGRVRVAFLLRQDGRIEGLRVVASSGSRALDRAALRCVRAVGRYRPIPEVLDREQWPLEINIDFRLGDG